MPKKWLSRISFRLWGIPQASGVTKSTGWDRALVAIVEGYVLKQMVNRQFLITPKIKLHHDPERGEYLELVVMNNCHEKDRVIWVNADDIIKAKIKRRRKRRFP